ncbi:MAG TPA: GGDEF domain-containing protein [Terriglobales bacterium]|nr:GGDEF domain-containing protein [Terriglobales bacterium]
MRQRATLPHHPRLALLKPSRGRTPTGLGPSEIAAAPLPPRSVWLERPRPHILPAGPRLIAPVGLDGQPKPATTLASLDRRRKVCDQLRTGRGAPEAFAEDLALQRALVAELRRRAACDPLAGMIDFDLLLQILRLELHHTRRAGRELTLLLLDLEGLKPIRDSLGSGVGKRALSRLAHVLLSCSRSIDTPACFGGNDFALIAPNTSVVAARALVRRLEARCARDGEQPPLTLSIGAATCPADGLSVEALLGAAYRSLYRRKLQPRLLPLSAPCPLPIEAERRGGVAAPAPAPLLLFHPAPRSRPAPADEPGS